MVYVGKYLLAAFVKFVGNALKGFSRYVLLYGVAFCVAPIEFSYG